MDYFHTDFSRNTPACLPTCHWRERPAKLVRHISAPAASAVLSEWYENQILKACMSISLSQRALYLFSVGFCTNWERKRNQESSKKATQVFIHLWLLRSHGRKYICLFQKGKKMFRNLICGFWKIHNKLISRYYFLRHADEDLRLRRLTNFPRA